MKKSIISLSLVFILAITGCESAYYKTMEAFGRHKRDILVDRVEDRTLRGSIMGEGLLFDRQQKRLFERLDYPPEKPYTVGTVYNSMVVRK